MRNFCFPPLRDIVLGAAKSQQARTWRTTFGDLPALGFCGSGALSFSGGSQPQQISQLAEVRRLWLYRFPDL